MKLRHRALLLFLFILSFTPVSYATTAIFSAFQTRYPNSPLITSMSCAICHPNSNTSQFTLYGQSVRSAKGTPDQRLAAVETLDADGDGFSNQVEILAGTNPSDPASRPTSPAPTPTPTPTPVPIPRPRSTFEIHALERLVDLQETGIQFTALAEPKIINRDDLTTFTHSFNLREKAEQQILLVWLDDWSTTTYAPRPDPGLPDVLADMRRLAPGKEFNAKTVEAMLANDFQETIIANQLRRRSTSTPIKAFALNLIDEQSVEIEQLLKWLNKYGNPFPYIGD